MEIAGKVAVITGAASGIGRAVAVELARRNVRAMALVDMGDNIDAVAAEVNAEAGRVVAHAYRGDTTDEAFRASVYDSISSQFDTVTMRVPAAGITRDDHEGSNFLRRALRTYTPRVYRHADGARVG